MLCRAGGHVVGGLVAWLLGDRDFVASKIASARAVAVRPLRHRGTRRTTVRFLGGARLAFSTAYLSTDRSGRRGRRRAVGRRGRNGGGCLAALEALGIQAQSTPALAAEVARQAVRCSSFEEAAEALGERGIRIDAKGVRALAVAVGEEALRQRELRATLALEGQVESDELADLRIVVSADGGRLRTRVNRRGARREPGARPRFDTPWREPELVIAYAIDAEGRKVRELPPLYDGTLGDADAAFEILLAELRLRGAGKARQIVVVADGAPWIWNRVRRLAAALGLAPGAVVPVADFYHAVEHLTAIAELVPRWKPQQRALWVKRMRRRLERGGVDAVIAAARALARGRAARTILSAVAYFEERRELMRYDRFRAQGIPLGSGAMESAVRRVVNLRLKGPGVFWSERTAEAMLHLRSYLESGRWDELVARVVHRTPDGRPAVPLTVAA